MIRASAIYLVILNCAWICTGGTIEGVDNLVRKWE
jgi:hypothetical protein